jgi:DNA topoisomerase-1
VFRFRGKSGKLHTVGVKDRRLARIVRQCRDLPGHELFEYLDESGEPRKVDSADVNEYLRAVSGEDFTAKDFRTWAGTVLACRSLREFETSGSETEAKKNMVEAIKAVAQRLGNTPAVCRKCYVHPAVLECYLAGKLERRVLRIVEAATDEVLREEEEEAMRKEERAVLELLRERLEKDRGGSSGAKPEPQQSSPSAARRKRSTKSGEVNSPSSRASTLSGLRHGYAGLTRRT